MEDNLRIGALPASITHPIAAAMIGVNQGPAAAAKEVDRDAVSSGDDNMLPEARVRPGADGAAPYRRPRPPMEWRRGA